MRHENDVVDVCEVAGTKEAIEWGSMKQRLAILVFPELINVIKQLNINTKLNECKQI